MTQLHKNATRNKCLRGSLDSGVRSVAEILLQNAEKSGLKRQFYWSLWVHNNRRFRPFLYFKSCKNYVCCRPVNVISESNIPCFLLRSHLNCDPLLLMIPIRKPLDGLCLSVFPHLTRGAWEHLWPDIFRLYLTIQTYIQTSLHK